jgi:trigger factor
MKEDITIMSVQVSVEKLEHNMAKLTITVDADRLDKAITNAYVKMRKNITAPGFRKGKVPQKLAEKLYGAEIFYEDAANELVNTTYPEAMEQVEDLTITSMPAFDLVKIEKGEDFIYTAEVATKPEVTLGQYKGLEVEAEEITVTAEDVDAELASVQKQNGREISIETPAEKDDTVVIDYVGTVDGEEFEGGSAENHSLKLGSGAFIPGFEDQLIGAKAGDDVKVEVTFPEEYHAEELAGKAAVFQVKVHEVKHTELPEIDDDLAQDVSEFDTLEEYKADLEKQIRERKEKAALEVKQQKLVDAIIENSEMDIPQVMIESAAEELLERYTSQMGIGLQQYMQYTGMSREDALSPVMDPALKNIQTSLVLQAIAEAEGLEMSDEELDAEFEKLAEQNNMQVDKLKELFDKNSMAAMRGDYVAQKALRFVTDAAVEVAPKAEDAE